MTQHSSSPVVVLSQVDLPEEQYDEGPHASLLQAIFNTSTLGLHVLKCVRNQEGKIIDFLVTLTNRASELIAGRRVSGMRMLEGWPNTKEIGLFDKFVAAVEEGVPVDYVQFYEADGVRAWYRWLATKLNDGLYVTIEDICDRKKDEEHLHETANRLRSALDGVPAMIALLDARIDRHGVVVDFTVSSANKALAIFSGCTTQELEGRSIKALYPQILDGEIGHNYFKVLTTGQPLEFEFYHEGVSRWFSILVTRQFSQKGIVVAAIDITERKRVEEEERKVQVLTSLNKIKTDFFSNVSHELRTPLTLILGPLEDVMKNSGLPKYQLQKLEMVRRNALRLLKGVNSLLDFSRIEAGRFETVFHPTDLAQFTTLLVSSFRSAVEASGLQLVLKMESPEPIYVNRDMWEKIVFNLLSNALKFTLKGRIEVILKSSRNHIQLHVCDSGIGIASENLERIFERFARVENVKARTYEGSGIGLALTRELVLIHTGSIKVKSKVGEGSEFIVSIPKGKKHLPQKLIHEFSNSTYTSKFGDAFTEEARMWEGANFSIDAIPTHSKERPVILLVDDNGDLRQYVKTILQGDFLIIDASNGVRAKALLDNGLVPDLILTDVMMPGMNGYELLREVKNNRDVAHVPVILISARATEEEKVQGINAGATDYLVKPFSAKELFALVESRIKLFRRGRIPGF